MQIWLYATDRALVSFCVIVTTFKTFKFINQDCEDIFMLVTGVWENERVEVQTVQLIS